MSNEHFQVPEFLFLPGLYKVDKYLVGAADSKINVVCWFLEMGTCYTHTHTHNYVAEDDLGLLDLLLPSANYRDYRRLMPSKCDFIL